MSIERIPQQRIDDAVSLLKRIGREFAPAAFANSLGAEDMVLTLSLIHISEPTRPY